MIRPQPSTVSTRSALIRLASTMPKGSTARRKLLAITVSYPGAVQLDSLDFGENAVILGGMWDGSGGEIMQGHWLASGVPA